MPARARPANEGVGLAQACHTNEGLVSWQSAEGAPDANFDRP